MKKIILLSLAFGLITSSCYATYHHAVTNNCSDANMLAKLNRETAQHRAVITDVTCEYTVPNAMPRRTTAHKKFEYSSKRSVRPTSTVVSVISTEQYCCDCE